MEGKWIEENTEMQVDPPATSEKENKDVSNEKVETNAANVILPNNIPLVSNDFLQQVQEMAKTSTTTISNERAETIALRKELDEWRVCS